MDDPNDNTLTDLERYKEPNLFRLSRRIRKISKRQASLEREWRAFLKEVVPGFARTSAVATLRRELDEIKKENRGFRSKLLGIVGAIALVIVKWVLDQLHK